MSDQDKQYDIVRITNFFSCSATLMYVQVSHGDRFIGPALKWISYAAVRGHHPSLTLYQL